MSGNDPPAPIAAVVLAAGLSTRMGKFKPLLPLGGRAIVARVVEALVAAEAFAPIIVVTGHERDQVRIALQADRVVFVHNDNYQHGEMLSSVQAGAAAIPRGCSAFLLCLADQPAILPSTLRQIADCWRRTRAAIVIPAYRGKRGHPVLFSIDCMPEILALPAGQTLKAVVERQPGRVLLAEVDDEGVVSDMDTAADYARVLRLWEARRPTS